jgi:L-fucose isomerase-like protein
VAAFSQFLLLMRIIALICSLVFLSGKAFVFGNLRCHTLGHTNVFHCHNFGDCPKSLKKQSFGQEQFVQKNLHFKVGIKPVQTSTNSRIVISAGSRWGGLVPCGLSG